MEDRISANANQSIRLLGIDPGLNITGYGVLEISKRSVSVLEAGVLRTKAKETLGNRLVELHEGILEVITQYKPQTLAIEELYSHYERPRTAILMGHARGVFVMAGATHGLDVHNYSATQVKKVLTGNGRAPKDQVQWAVCRELSLEQAPDPPDVSDALAIALTHFHLTKSELILS